jgi:hypothetical protein
MSELEAQFLELAITQTNSSRNGVIIFSQILNMLATNHNYYLNLQALVTVDYRKWPNQFFFVAFELT